MNPRFVKAKLLKGGEVQLVDNDGEIYHVQMHRDFEWPILSRRIRQVEMRRSFEERQKPLTPEPPRRMEFKPKIIA